MKDRLPTKENLMKRGIVTEEADLVCPLCNQHPETAYHLFINCELAQRIWQACYSWISSNYAFDFPYSLQGHFWAHSGIGKTNKEIHTWKVIWGAVMFFAFGRSEMV